MKIRTKITLGFGGIILIAVALSAVAIISIQKIKHSTVDIRDIYVPVENAAVEAKAHLLKAMFENRGYTMDGSSKSTNYLVKGMESLTKADECLKKLDGLIRTNKQDLGGLDKQLSEATNYLAEYKNGLNESVSAINQMNEDEGNIDSLMQTIEKQCNDYIKGQYELFAAELSSNTVTASTFKARYEKTTSIFEIYTFALHLDKERLKVQIGRDSKSLSNLVSNIDVLIGKIDDMYKISIRTNNLQQLAKMRECSINIKKAVQDYGISMERLLTLNKQRIDCLEKALAQIDTLCNSCISASSTARKQTVDTAARTSVMMVLITVVGIMAAVGISIIITKNIIPPLQKAVVVTQKVASGDLTESMDMNRTDEIGDLANAVNTMIKDLRTNIGSMQEVSNSLASASEELSSINSQVSANVEETNAQSNVVASAAEQVSKSVTTVATSTEEISATIKEIAKQAGEMANLANQATSSAEKASQTMNRLNSSSGEIGNVVKLITSIAEQTNLLALNATIEAARAGEAGKGFAVVANEVKELAKQTGRATEEIAQKIGTVQQDSKATIDSIREVGEMIQKIDQTQTQIASAVEEQSVTMNEIAKNATEAAKGAQEIARNISGVSQAADNTSKAVSHSVQATKDLAKTSNDLLNMSARYKLNGNSDKKIISDAVHKSRHSDKVELAAAK